PREGAPLSRRLAEAHPQVLIIALGLGWGCRTRRAGGRTRRWRPSPPSPVARRSAARGRVDRRFVTVGSPGRRWPHPERAGHRRLARRTDAGWPCRQPPVGFPVLGGNPPADAEVTGVADDR